MTKAEIRLPEQHLDALRAYSRWFSYENGVQFQWTDAARLAISRFLEAEGARSVTAGGVDEKTT
jgi:hypothetical protein